VALGARNCAKLYRQSFVDQVNDHGDRGDPLTFIFCWQFSHNHLLMIKIGTLNPRRTGLTAMH